MGVSDRKRIGIIGGMSWESTSVYYRLLNELHPRTDGAWSQPRVLIDSVDFGPIVDHQRAGDWAAAGAVLADSARRLADAGATVLGIGANTMHKCIDDVRDAVALPVIDVRDAVAHGVRALGGDALALLGTAYVVQQDFYSDRLDELGITVVKPTDEQAASLQRIVFDELTRGIVLESSREELVAIAESCRRRGGDIVGLCCTEFGMLVDAANAPFPFVDSTVAHVRALLAELALQIREEGT